MINKCKECGCVVRHGNYCSQKDGERVSDRSPVAGSVELLRELMDACSPYLIRKKMTPRHECNALNDVWAKCAEHLEKQNEKTEGRN